MELVKNLFGQNGYFGPFDGAVEPELLTAREYFALLEHGLSTVHKERYVRFHARWAANDSRRGRSESIPLSHAETLNLEALALLLDESDVKDLLSKAELMRELGRFDEATAMLDKIVGGVRSPIAQNMRSLIEQRDSLVRPLPNSRSLL